MKIILWWKIWSLDITSHDLPYFKCNETFTECRQSNLTFFLGLPDLKLQWKSNNYGGLSTCWVTIARRWWLAQADTDVSARSGVVSTGRARCSRPRTPGSSPGDSGRARPKCRGRSTGSPRRGGRLRPRCTEDRPPAADAGTRSTACRWPSPDSRPCCSAEADCSANQASSFRGTSTIRIISRGCRRCAK